MHLFNASLYPEPPPTLPLPFFLISLVLLVVAPVQITGSLVTSSALLGGTTKKSNQEYLELVLEGGHPGRWHPIVSRFFSNKLVHTYLAAVCSY